ncbi:hypothetical protein TNCV_1130091 [Trichonephila clavipes]|nr:hypothetical protein TNCV_1130091 [Trichonephila clavipes]
MALDVGRRRKSLGTLVTMSDQGGVTLTLSMKQEESSNGGLSGSASLSGSAGFSGSTKVSLVPQISGSAGGVGFEQVSQPQAGLINHLYGGFGSILHPTHVLHLFDKGLDPQSHQDGIGDGRVLDMQDGRGFETLHKQVARVLHQSRTSLETDGKTRGQRRQFGVQNVKDDVGSHQF